jgi:hypothetical protein
MPVRNGCPRRIPVVPPSGQSERPHPSPGSRPPREQKRQTRRTSRSRAIRSGACALRAATLQASGVTVLATGGLRPDRPPRRDLQPPPAQRPQPGQQAQPHRQFSRRATTEAGAAPIARPAPAPAARIPRAGTDRPQAARPERGRSAGTRRYLASRRRCTRPGSSPHGTATVTARPCRWRPWSRLTLASRAPSAARLGAMASSRQPGSRRTPRPAPAPERRATTSGRTAPMPSLVTRCWPSATRPQT